MTKDDNQANLEGRLPHDLFFNQSLIGAFVMMLDHPIVWNDAVDKDTVLNYVVQNQHITRVNQVLLDQFQLNTEQMARLTPGILFGHDRKQGRRAWRKLFDNGHLRMETEGKRADSTSIWIEGEYNCLYDDKKRIIGHFGVQQDITARKKAEQWGAYICSVADCVSDSIIITDKQFRITQINQAAEALFGYRLKEVIGCSPELFNAEALAGSIQQDVYDAVAKGAVYQNILLNRRKDGSVFTSEIKVTRINDEKGRPLAYVGIQRDVTAQLEREKVLQQCLDRNKQPTQDGGQSPAAACADWTKVLQQWDRPVYDPLTVMLLSQSGLKTLSAALGQLQADQQLQAAEDIIRSNCPTNVVICRYGSDGHCLLLPSTREQQAGEISKGLLQHTENAVKGKMNLCFAIGFATRQCDEPLEQVILLAEQRLNRSRRSMNQDGQCKAIDLILQQIWSLSPLEKQHQDQVAALCATMAKALGLNERTVQVYRLAGTLHDIGKIRIPSALNNKKEPFSAAESEIRQSHVEIGYQILKTADAYAELAEPVLHHHENWDGTGYPDGLAGSKIPPLARLLRLADTYATMTMGKQDKPTQDKAVSQLEKGSGRSFDPQLVRVLIDQVLVEVIVGPVEYSRETNHDT